MVTFLSQPDQILQPKSDSSISPKLVSSNLPAILGSSLLSPVCPPTSSYLKAHGTLVISDNFPSQWSPAPAPASPFKSLFLLLKNSLHSPTFPSFLSGFLSKP
ncbi:hypothetical protein XENOCAPTIV_011637 [Xenoophorus captivus]|uniref:Ubinuclein 1 n=1 Tax=Xenoophorus captivus TaxID=1517983 RepID=A0ABV0QSF1_9TELE